MRLSVDFRRSSLSVLASLTTVLAAVVGLQACAGDGFSDSLVGGLAGASDLTPLIATNAAAAVPATSTVATTRSKSLGRQSVPSADRATSYRDGELFRNSKVAVPLLVADLEPRVASRARPMTGRSVGARPSASWTNPRVSVVTPANLGRESTMAWAGLSGR
jgi:hypothetical protein